MTLPRLLTMDGFGFLVSLGIAVTTGLLLSSRQLVILIIITGQAHFLLTYLYQWRAKKVGPSKVTLYAMLVLVLGTLLTVTTPPHSWVVLLAGSVFGLHAMSDELHMSKNTGAKSSLPLVLAFGTIYAALLAYQLYGLYAPSVAFAVTTLPGLAYTHKHALSRRDIPLLLVTAWLLFLYLLQLDGATITTILTSIILFHFVRWYIHIFRRCRATKYLVTTQTYIRDVFIMNAVCIGGYFLYAHNPQFAVILRSFFEPAYYYGWTTIHILLSVRLPGRRAYTADTV